MVVSSGRRCSMNMVPTKVSRTVPLWATLCIFLLVGLSTISAIHLENDLEFLQELGNKKSPERGDGTDDFGFAGAEDEGGVVEEWSGGHSRVQRLWGVADTQAIAGHVFQYPLPSDAFSGKVDRYEVSSPQNTPLPGWLHFDTSTSTFEGVPLDADVGEHYVVVRAISDQPPQSVAKDVFSIEVIPANKKLPGAHPTVQFPDLAPAQIAKTALKKVECDQTADQTVLLVVLDADPKEIQGQDRAVLVKSMANFLGVDEMAVELYTHNSHEDLIDDENVILAGPGNARESNKELTVAVKWQVGCDGEVSTSNQQLVNQVKNSARDGNLAAMFKKNIIGWQLRLQQTAPQRSRREVGSGDFDHDDETYDDYEEEAERVPESRFIPTMSSPIFPEVVPTYMQTHHPHRHHHGNMASSAVHPHRLSPLSAAGNQFSSPHLYGTPIMTPTLDPVRPTYLMSSWAPRYTHDDIPVQPSITPHFGGDIESSVGVDTVSAVVTEPLQNTAIFSTPFLEMSEDIQPTAAVSYGSEMSSTVWSSSVFTPSPEIIERGPKNFPPKTTQRMRKQAVTAGSAFRILIPVDTFSDFEDGDTRSLRLIFKTKDGASLPRESWVQFDPEKQEIYGLPLEDDVSRWEFQLEAMDSEGDTVSDEVEINVRQHPGSRAVNHKFGLHIKVEKTWDFPSNVDWELTLMDRLAQFFGDSSKNNVLVQSVKLGSNSHEFYWTNSSLPRHDVCPEMQIKELYEHLALNNDGHPTTALQNILAPEFSVKRVSLEMLANCDGKSPLGQVPKPQPPPEENYAPSLRNPVDQVNATVGEFMFFQVPEDLCYDPEDGSARYMKLKLLTIDRVPIPADKWLQFDVKNQEFNGLPLDSDAGAEEYQLVCEDKGGLTAIDGLVVVVHPRPKHRKYSVEFSVHLNTSYDAFVTNAAHKQRVVEKIASLFQDRDFRNIIVKSIVPGSVVVTWYNRSLPYDPCPEEEVAQLRRILLNDDGTVTKRAAEVFQAEHLTRARVVPIDVCLGKKTPTHATKPPPIIDDSKRMTSDDDYLVTFIVPAVIIVVMLLIAAIIACVLYRKRRKGKMTMEENKTFINKGIPIIFQDELEDKPDPAKSPVIMKDEKPPMPMPPPEYHRDSRSPSRTPPPEERSLLNAPADSDATPYQPPPPFTTNRDSNRQSRPKPSPAYRKPPPYVPP